MLQLQLRRLRLLARLSPPRPTTTHWDARYRPLTPEAGKQIRRILGEMFTRKLLQNRDLIPTRSESSSNSTGLVAWFRFAKSPEGRIVDLALRTHRKLDIAPRTSMTLHQT